MRQAHPGAGGWQSLGVTSPLLPPRHLHLLREPQRDPGAPSIYRRNVPKLQGTARRRQPRCQANGHSWLPPNTLSRRSPCQAPLPGAAPVPSQGARPRSGIPASPAQGHAVLTPWLSPRTASWSARTSTTMTATSPTAPSAAAAARCSCAATTTAAGPGLPSRRGAGEVSVMPRSWHGAGRFWGCCSPSMGLRRFR